MSKVKRVFVAGHKGLLGSAVVRTLEKEGLSQIVAKDRKELNLLDQQQTFQFFKEEKIDQVYLCAAKVGGIQANINSPAQFLYENLQIQNNIIEGARRAEVKKLLFVGSSCIYPREAPNPIHENSLLTGPLEPTNEGYALAKVAGIKMCQFYRKQYGCNYISAVPTNLYGINDHYDLVNSHLVPALILKVHNAKCENKSQIELWGSGKPRREFMLSDDCAEALLFLMNRYDSAETVNIGIGSDLSIVEIAKAVSAALGWQGELVFDSSKPDGMMKKLIDTSRMEKLGWKPRYSLQEGVKIAYDDFLKRMGK